MPKLLVCHLTATELELNAHFVPFGQEVFGMDDFDVVIVGINPDTEFHFLHFATLLVLVSFFLVLLLNVLVFAVVDDLAHRRVCIRRDLHKIQPALFSDTDRLVGRHDTELMPVLLDHAHFRRTNALIDPSLIDVAPIARTSLTRAIERRPRRAALPSPLITTSRACSSRRTWPLPLRANGTRYRVILRSGWTRPCPALIVLRARRKIAAIQLLEWIAYGVPPCGFNAPWSVCDTTREIFREQRVADFMSSARPRSRHVRAFMCPVLRDAKDLRIKNHAGKIKWGKATLANTPSTSFYAAHL